MGAIGLTYIHEYWQMLLGFFLCGNENLILIENILHRFAYEKINSCATLGCQTSS
jgi:hypothetical protein